VSLNPFAFVEGLSLKYPLDMENPAFTNEGMVASTQCAQHKIDLTSGLGSFRCILCSVDVIPVVYFIAMGCVP
jgi:hypothetical protein